MSIDEAINILKSDNDYNKSIGCDTSYEEQLAEWLEELKAYREIGTVEECRNSVLDIEKAYNKGYSDGSLSVTEEIRGKAIYDFAERLKSEYERYDIDDVFENSDIAYTKACYIFEQYIEQIAEQLKEGVLNE